MGDSKTSSWWWRWPAVAALLLVSPALAEDAAWRTLSVESDGLLVEARDVADSAFPELRLRAATTAAPAALVDAAWKLRTDGVHGRYLTHQQVLNGTTNERRLYLRIDAPLLGRRECVLRQRRWLDEADGTWRMQFRTEAITGPARGIVSFGALSGSWTFQPNVSGGSLVEYLSFTDPGEFPAWLVRGAQLDAAIATVREIVSHALHTGRP